MWNVETLKDYQVIGGSLRPIIDGFGSFTLLASSYLVEGGIGTPDENMMVVIDPNKWYPLDRWVSVFGRIHQEFGDFTLRQVGLHVPKYVVTPPQIIDVTTAIKFMDIGYYLNHGKNGEPLFNIHTGQMQDGIGHYRAVLAGPGVKKISCEVDSPYPCPFDEGLVTAATQKFEPTAVVTHDKSSCRTKGGRSCTYHIAWK